jgi:hypothetical protein
MAGVVTRKPRAALSLALGAMIVAATACRTGEPKDVGADIKVATEQLPPQVPNVASWDALSAEVRQEIFESAYRRYPNLAMSERRPVAQLKGTPGAALADRMVSYMRGNGTMAVEDRSHARVGDVEISVVTLALTTGEVLAAEVQFLQRGCEMPDETAPHFKTLSEAASAGCDVSDINQWTAHGVFNHDGTPFEAGDYLEWAGA